MKKNILSILLALVLVLGLMVLVTPAVLAEESVTHSHCCCVNAEHVPTDHICEQNVVWEDLSTATIADGGHYYLTKNLAKSITVKSSIEITICLNGYDLHSTKTLTVYGGGVVNICNCQSTGRVYSTRNSTNTGYALMISSSKTGGIGTVNLWSGKISGAASDSTHCRAVEVKGGIFNMYGGQVVNGWAGYDAALDTVKFGYGGNICVYNNAGKTAQFNMYGGTVTGGQAAISGGNIYIEGGKFTMHGGTVTGGKNKGTPTKDAPLTGMGGNIFVTSTGAVGTVTINGGTITGGSAYNGGNIAADGQNVEDNTNGKKVDIKINGGTITGGKATDGGGNIYLHNTTNGVVLNMTAGTITAGKASIGGNIVADGPNPPSLTGGTISNGQASKNGGNIYIKNGNTFDLEGVTVSGGTAGKSATGEAYSGNGGNIYIESGNTFYVNTGTVTGGIAKSGGNIWCAGRLVIKGGTISDGVAHGAAGNIRIQTTGASLNMTDGVISGGRANNRGGNLYSLNCTNLSITGGQILDGIATGGEGGNLYITHSSLTEDRTVTLQNVTISGGRSIKAANNDGNVTGGQGGNLCILKTGKVTIDHSTVEGGNAIEGDNLYLSDNLTVNITGGSFTALYGSRSYVYDAAKHTGYTQEQIETYGLNNPGDKQETTGNGGNITINNCGDLMADDKVTVTEYGYVNITGTTIMGGNAKNGGAIYLGQGNLTLDGITAKTCGGEFGKVLYIAKDGTATVKDSTLINWDTQGTTVVVGGKLILQGDLSMPRQYNAIEMTGEMFSATEEILIRCDENENAVMEITGLTGVDGNAPTAGDVYGDGVVAVARSRGTGLIATGAAEGQTSLFTSSAPGYSIYYADGGLFFGNSIIQSMDENGVAGGYSTLEEALAAADANIIYFRINSDLDSHTISGDMILDLQGHHLTNITVDEGVVLQLMDNSANGGGSVSGTIRGQIHPIVEKNEKTYLTMQKDGTFFVYDSSVQLTHVSLDPANDALGYKAQISGNDAIMGCITEFGFRMWVNEDNIKTYTKTENITSTLTLRLKNILAAGGGETEIYGEAFFTLTVNGETFTVTSAEYQITMKEVVETVNKVLEEDRGSYSKTQVSALQALLDKNKKAVSGWSTKSIMYWLPIADEMVQIMAADSMVLLKNENQALPLAKDTKINLFGYNATTKGLLVTGGGSGGTRTAEQNKVDMLRAFQDAGVQVNVDLYNAYAAWDDLDLDSNSTAASTPMCTLTNPGADFYSEERIANAKAFSDTAVVVIGRWSRENARVTDDNGVLHYEIPDIQVKSKMADDPSRTYLQLTTEEEYMLKVVTENFDNVIVLLNLCNTMELGFLDDYGIDAAMFIGTPGQSGVRAIPRLLYGQITPSGKTADIYPYNHKADPTWANANVDLSNSSNKYVTYQEGIYYGYRWYETAFADEIRINANGIMQDFSTEEGYRKIVQFPFGFGLSYTKFAWELVEAPSGVINQATDSFTVKVKVTNTGDVAGKDVVQLYLNAPYTPGGIEKAALTLVDFGKTDTLQPGQSQILELSFTAYDLASYDCYDANKNGFAGYELENGTYTFKLMTDSHTSANLEFALQVAKNISISTDPVTGQVVENLFTGENAYGSPVDGGVNYMSRVDFAGTFPTARVAGNQTVTVAPAYTGELKTILYGQDNGLYLVTREDGSKATLADLTGETDNVLVWNKELLLQLQDYDNPLWEQFLAQITKEEAALMIKEGGFRVNGTESLGLIETEETDGPSGLSRVDSNVRTAWPGPSLNACSWNKGLLYDMGRAVAMEARKADIQGWYAPGVNLHRTPYNSRNFEYYSEDPVLSGALGAQCISGAKQEGLTCYLKHFAVSEAGKNPTLVKTWLTEQAMREVYLKAFEIAVKEGGTNAVMSAFNCIGDVFCGHNPALLQGVLRNEWGFRGAVITDWWSTYMTIHECVLAGNDKMLMPADKVTEQEVDLSDDGGQLANASRQAVKNIVYSVVDSCVSGKLYERPVGNLDVEDATDEGAAGEE